jgi:predicted glycogen debranching enzyme
MTTIVRRIAIDDAREHPDVSREWLVTNGLGGYASGTVSGIMTRRYHALLIAALPAPMGRVVMLSHVQARVRTRDGRLMLLDPEWLSGDATPHHRTPLAEFRLESGLPIWRYKGDDFVIEKRVVMPYRQNTVHISYRLLEASAPMRVELRPFVHFRYHESAVSETFSGPYALTVVDDRFEISAGADRPTLRLLIQGEDSALTFDRWRVSNLEYFEERNRGYAHDGAVWSPGYFHLSLDLDQPSAAEGTLVASTENWDTVRALTPQDAIAAESFRRVQLLAQACPEARSGVPAELVLAADQFIITPAGRVEEAARASAAGDEVRTVIAGYHWFTDWGRDTMISLEGLTLLTGRYSEAGFILRTFAHYVRDGLIPNLFPEGEREGLYHTADATLWYFHAVDRYVKATGDIGTLRLLLPTLRDIIAHHQRGTRFGICVDTHDGLLRQGQEGYQLTWMDAKVDDWVVTPRRGKAVEINALYYNALRLLEEWTREEDGPDTSRPYAEAAELVRASFNARFWYAAGSYLYDVVDGESGDDASCRPNQIFAISLPHPVLEPNRWRPVVDVVRSKLLTPVGLRSLSSDHPSYRAQYYGDLRARDAAYHQGTVWAWLLGPFVDAWLKVSSDDRDLSREMLDGISAHLNEACIGSISEIFDAEPPFTPRGCIAQAWSVAEILRALVRTGVRDAEASPGAPAAVSAAAGPPAHD